MASYPIADLDAIESFYKTKLKAAGIRSTAKLLAHTRTPSLRKQLAAKTGIPIEKITGWAHLADLMRIRGVAAEYAELLAAAGADTVKELRRRSAASVVRRMNSINGRKKALHLLPSETRVSRWVAEAKKIDPFVTY